MSEQAIKAAFFSRQLSRNEAVQYLVDYGHYARTAAARTVAEWATEYRQSQVNHWILEV